MRAGLVWVDFIGSLVFPDRAAIIFLHVIDHSQIIHGARIFFVGFGRALEVFLRLIKIGEIQVSDADHVQVYGVLRLALQ